MKPQRGVIIVFAKAPRSGLVKTRMSPPLSAEQAAELYANLLDDVLATTAEFSSGLGLEPVLAVYPPDAGLELSARAPSDFRIIPQRGRDLGERMTWAAAEAAAAGARCILLRGSDSPTLDPETVASVVDGLQEYDVVICPDQDGGYSLVGMRRFAPGLFDHAMSTRSVLEDTLANAARLGLRSDLRGVNFDLDTAKDLALLAEARRQGAASQCPRTLAYLDANALWPDRDSRDTHSGEGS